MVARTYPPGVPCWVDIGQPDLAAASTFYGGLFGWTFAEALPGEYLIAQLDGQDVAGIGTGTGDPAWYTYLAVADADASAAAVVAAGGTIVAPPRDAGPGGRSAGCVDPVGAGFRLWQARRRPGAQRVNRPGTWNFSILRAADPAAALTFYQTVFGWLGDDVIDGIGAMVRVPGYGDHLAATVDPDIHRRQGGVVPRFADVVAGVEPASPGEPAHWYVKFAVADRDASAARVEELGGTVVSTVDTAWTREAGIRDPQGGRFGLSQFAPPG